MCCGGLLNMRGLPGTNTTRRLRPGELRRSWRFQARKHCRLAQHKQSVIAPRYPSVKGLAARSWQLPLTGGWLQSSWLMLTQAALRHMMCFIDLASSRYLKVKTMLYEMSLIMEYFNQRCEVVWNYVSTTPPSGVLGSLGLITGLGFIPSGSPPTFPSSTLAANLEASLSNQLTFLEVLCKAASDYDPSDFYDYPIPGAITGEVTGDAMTPFVAYGFYSSRVISNIKRGFKRFPGVSETMVGAGGVIGSGELAALESVASLMSDQVTYSAGGGTVTYTPCVVSKKKYTTPKGNPAYEYYPTLTEQLEHIAQGIIYTPYDTVRSQTSRQYGKGK